MNLYIIGNGFDIDHGIKSKYIDFKHFLENSLDINAKVLLDVIENSYRNNDNMLWKDLEKSIGELDLDYYIEKDVKNLTNAIMFTENFSCLFKKWVNYLRDFEIIKESTKKNLKHLFNENRDVFFSFNYTPTLEKIYNINKDNIKYIHMVKNGESYEFGHEKIGKINEIGHANFGVRNYLRQQLSKDTSKIYDNNRSWFEELSQKNIENIYFYGFSFANIDLIYIKGVLNNVNKNKLKSIYLYSYKNQKEIDYEEQKCILNSLIDEAELSVNVEKFQLQEE
ncbi:AbiH family protein [Staphylococcus epidermidis]|uniref:Bacteriophage abortive infection AbiH n=1 Tax=Staphylococcus epidermidis TaxID=1282 RepID=A0A169T0L7_STAEP|nr:bacteriophage abortive infection AbiH family protein [Staphylococcus epidermidis]BAU98223.1 hypothetical protein [Staphylococcus epidermidis]